MVPEPGLYYGMPREDYFAADAVSMSKLSTLLSSFPARLLHETPQTKPMQDGEIAHALVLEGRDITDSDRFIVVPKGFSMAQVKKYADLIEEIESRPGVIQVSEERIATIRACAEVLRNDPEIAGALSNGHAEVSAFWIEKEYGLLCKARFDWLPNRGEILPDYKTSHCIDDDPLGRQIKDYRLAHRSAWYEDAARYAAGREDPIYLPIWQEKKPPYFAVMRQVNRAHVALARLELGRALAIYAHCKAEDHWPGPEHFKEVDLAPYEVKRLEWEYQTEMGMQAQQPMDIEEELT